MISPIEIGQIILTHLQFLSLLNNLDIEWPDSWRQILSWVEVFNLDFNDIMIEHDLPRFDFRAIFVLIAVILPILIILLVLVIFNPIYVVMWYAVLVLGFIIGAVGAIGYYLPSATGFASEQAIAMGYMTVGFTVCGVCIVFGLAHRARQKRERLSPEKEKEQALQFNAKRSLRHFLVSVVSLVVGGILTGIIDTSSTGYSVDTETTQGAVVRGIAAVLFGIGILAAVYFFLNLIPAGRRFTFQLGITLHKHLLKLMLIVISASFIPVISYCVNMFMCVEYTCPAGTKFNPFVHRPVGNISRSETIFCDPCVFDNNNNNNNNNNNTGGCPYSMELMCPAFSDRRLAKFPDISCTSEAHPYFLVSAVLSSFVYLVGVPTLFHRTVSMCCKIIRSKIKIIEMPGETFSDTDRWRMQVYTSGAAPSSLYRPYKHITRFYSITHLFHKLSVVVMLILVAPFRSDVAIVLTLIIHSIGTIIMFRARPYLSSVEGTIAGSLAICNILNSMYGIIVWKEGNSVPDSTTAIFIILNGVIPIFALVVVELCVNRRMNKRLNERRETVERWVKKIRAAAKLAKKKRIAAEKKLRAQPPVRENPISSESGGAPYGHESGDDNNNSNNNVEIEMDGLDIDPSEAMRLNREFKDAEEHNAEVDREINVKVEKLMTRHFMVMGFVCFLALGFSILGSLRTPVDEFVNASYGQTENEEIFGGKESWIEFVSSCCCLPNTKELRDFDVTERWVCASEPFNSHNNNSGSGVTLGRTVSRGRVPSGSPEDSGLAIRRLCARNFTYNNNTLHHMFCGIFGSDTKLTCPVKPQGVTDRAVERYW
eukprot:PhM_4_TR17385/c2_g1_i8/m.32823